MDGQVVAFGADSFSRPLIRVEPKWDVFGKFSVSKAMLPELLDNRLSLSINANCLYFSSMAFLITLLRVSAGMLSLPFNALEAVLREIPKASAIS